MKRGFLEGMSNKTRTHGVRWQAFIPRLFMPGAAGSVPIAAGGSTAARTMEDVCDINDIEQTEPSTADMLHALLERATQLVRSEFQDLHWQAFWRSAIDGLPTDLVATQLNITPASVRQARSRILRRLRVIMGDAP